MNIATKEVRGELKVITGNGAAAYGALLCRPDVIAIYPITPQSEVAERLAEFKANGLLDAEMMEVEGENSAMIAIIAASLAGARVFTATAACGLEYMHEATIEASSHRSPVVMVNVNRETSLQGVSCSRQDIMTARDTGWLHLEAENCQEILDMVIMAYRLAEDIDILVPTVVSYDGFYLSYLTDGVVVPLQKDVDEFLSPLAKQPERLKVVPGGNLSHAGYAVGELFTEYRYKLCVATERAKEKLVKVERDFERIFGRSYSGVIEEYRTDDAEVVLITMGSSTGTARVAVDKKREQGIKVGLIKIRMFRPFPKERLLESLRGRKGIGIIERSVCFGWNCGHLYMELRAAIGNSGIVLPIADFIGGIGGTDITIEQIERAIDETYQASQSRPFKELTWLSLE